MKDLLLDIAGLNSEDLTTEILRIILIKEEYAVYQKLFFNSLFKNNENKSTIELRFEIKSQEVFEEGRPDLIILGEKEVIVIENKFYAGFSKGDQITRYRKIMDKYFPGFKKRLYIITLAERVKDYSDQLRAMNENADFLIWEDVLKLFKSDNFLIQALTGYIEEVFLKKIDIRKEDEMFYKTKAAAEAMDKLKTIVDQARNELSRRQLPTGRMSQSINFYGFYVGYEKVTVWFGYGLPWWSNKNLVDDRVTPLFIQIRDVFSPNPPFDDTIKDKLENAGFISIGQEGFIRPISVDLFNDTLRLATEIETIIKGIKF